MCFYQFYRDIQKNKEYYLFKKYQIINNEVKYCIINIFLIFINCVCPICPH